MRIKVELELEYGDFRTIDLVAQRLGLDPESTIKFLLRKGLESIMAPQQPQPQPNDLENTEVKVDEPKQKGKKR